MQAVLTQQQIVDNMAREANGPRGVYSAIAAEMNNQGYEVLVTQPGSKYRSRAISMLIYSEKSGTAYGIGLSTQKTNHPHVAVILPHWFTVNADGSWNVRREHRDDLLRALCPAIVASASRPIFVERHYYLAMQTARS